MPLYILCPVCQVVPVTKLGERCDDCLKKQKKADDRNEATLNKQEQKPRDWRDVFGMRKK